MREVEESHRGKEDLAIERVDRREMVAVVGREKRCILDTRRESASPSRSLNEYSKKLTILGFDNLDVTFSQQLEYPDIFSASYPCELTDTTDVHRADFFSIVIVFCRTVFRSRAHVVESSFVFSVLYLEILQVSRR